MWGSALTSTGTCRCWDCGSLLGRLLSSQYLFIVDFFPPPFPLVGLALQHSLMATPTCNLDHYLLGSRMAFLTGRGPRVLPSEPPYIPMHLTSYSFPFTLSFGLSIKG